MIEEKYNKYLTNKSLKELNDLLKLKSNIYENVLEPLEKANAILEEHNTKLILDYGDDYHDSYSFSLLINNQPKIFRFNTFSAKKEIMAVVGRIVCYGKFEY